MRTIGLDVGRQFAEVAIREEGRTRSAGRIPVTPDGLRAFAASLRADDEVVLEATTNTWAIAGLLAERGYTPENIAAIMHGNWLRLLRTILK